MTRVEVVTAAGESDAVELWPVYDAVFGDAASEREWRDGVWDRHASRDGLRLARAYDGADALVGFAYGYTGRRGQWWTDTVAPVLGPEVADAWLDGHFELVSIGVLPSARGTGAGTALLRALTHDLPHERWLLMTTADADDPARRLYAREGWSVVGPGIAAGQVVMGRIRPSGR